MLEESGSAAVESTTSLGAHERRPDIVLESAVPMHVHEVQTVGGPSG